MSIRKILCYFSIWLISGSSFGQRVDLIESSKSVGLGKARSVDVLARTLTKDLATESDKCLAIYTWIIHNIRYDTKQFGFGKVKLQSSKKTLRKRKGVCSHYALLLKDLCTAADLICEEVDGNIDRELWVYRRPLAYHNSDHTWNAIKLDGQWELLDVTFDAGYVINKAPRFARFLKRLFNVPFVKSRFVFIQKPEYNYFKLNPKKMIVDHLPLAPMWQLLRDTMSIHTFRLNMTQKMKYLERVPRLKVYNFEDTIDQYYTTKYKAKFIGESNRFFSDTNYFAAGYGQENFVNLKLLEYGKTKTSEIEDLERRFTDYDTLKSNIAESKAFYTKQKHVEKSVHRGFRLSQKQRYKTIHKENTDLIRRSNTCRSIDRYLERSVHQLSKKLKEKNTKLEKARTKLSGQQLKQKKAIELKSKKELEQWEETYNLDRKQIVQLIDTNEKIKKDLELIEVNFRSLSDQVSKVLFEQISTVSESENWLIMFSAIYDSIYFAARNNAKKLDTLHLSLRDSLITLMTKKRGDLLNAHYRNMVDMSRAIRSMMASYSQLSQYVDVEEFGEEIILFKKQILTVYTDQIKLNKAVIDENHFLKNWFKQDHRNQNSLMQIARWERRTESKHYLKNQENEHERYYFRLKELRRHKVLLSGYYSAICAQLREIRFEMKERAQRNK